MKVFDGGESFRRTLSNKIDDGDHHSVIVHQSSNSDEAKKFATSCEGANDAAATGGASTSHIASSLRMAHLPVMAVAGMQHSPTNHLKRKRSRLGSSTSFIPTHRASYHGSRDTSINRLTDSPVKSRSGDFQYSDIRGCAESLVGRVLFEQGLGKYCDPDFVRATQRELAEAVDLTQEEMDRAAHQLLQLERRQSMPHVHLCLEEDPNSGTGDTNRHLLRTSSGDRRAERAVSALGYLEHITTIDGNSATNRQQPCGTPTDSGKSDSDEVINQTRL